MEEVKETRLIFLKDCCASFARFLLKINSCLVLVKVNLLLTQVCIGEDKGEALSHKVV